jgi:hypothetical protein
MILTLLHLYKHIYAQTHKHIQINHRIIYVYLCTYINAHVQHFIYWQGQHVCDALFISFVTLRFSKTMMPCVIFFIPWENIQEVWVHQVVS